MRVLAVLACVLSGAAAFMGPSLPSATSVRGASPPETRGGLAVLAEPATEAGGMLGSEGDSYVKCGKCNAVSSPPENGSRTAEVKFNQFLLVFVLAPVGLLEFQHQVTILMHSALSSLFSSLDVSHDGRGERRFHVLAPQGLGCLAHSRWFLQEVGGGKRMKCAVCSNTWFQSRDRLLFLSEGLAFKDYPDSRKDAVQLSMAAGHVRPGADSTCFVGNLPYDVGEEVSISGCEVTAFSC
jgi:hypothetical protein